MAYCYSSPRELYYIRTRIFLWIILHPIRNFLGIILHPNTNLLRNCITPDTNLLIGLRHPIKNRLLCDHYKHIITPTPINSSHPAVSYTFYSLLSIIIRLRELAGTWQVQEYQVYRSTCITRVLSGDQVLHSRNVIIMSQELGMVEVRW